MLGVDGDKNRRDREPLAECADRINRIANDLAILAEEIDTARDLQGVFRPLLGFARRSIQGTVLVATLFDPATQLRTCVFAACETNELDLTSIPPLPLNEAPLSRAIVEGQVIVTGDLGDVLTSSVPASLLSILDVGLLRSSVAIPLRTRESVIGAIEVLSLEPNAFGAEHVAALRMAGLLVASTVDHVTLLDHECRLRTAAEASERRYRALVHNTYDIILVLDGEQRLQFVSPSVERLLGYRVEQLVGTDLLDYIYPDDLDAARKLIGQPPGEPSAALRELRIQHHNGSWHHVELVATQFHTEGSAGSVVINARDVTEWKQTEEQLRHFALHDPLTGLPNRTLFSDRLGQAIERTKRRDSGLFAILFLDLDRFKLVNDSLGHLVGDELLVSVARRLESCLRPGDTVARLGGDEFTLLLNDLADAAQAIAIAERTQKALATPFSLSGQEVATSASIGIAISSPVYTRAEELLRDADTALYRAKLAGRARHEIFDREMQAQVAALLALEADLRRAIKVGEFALYYQPIISRSGGMIVGAEALLRWQHPERGLVSPGEFIDVAEETGLIADIGAWALRAACTQAKAWHDLGMRLPISVNLSAPEFKYRNIRSAVAEICRDTAFDPSFLKVELTEGVFMEQAGKEDQLHELHQAGVAVAIDDFGTGSSSLSTLHRFLVATLKIDRSFIRNLTTDQDDAAIVRTIIGMAHSLKLDVVAEGVETEAQLDFLQAHDCDAYQGYLFSPALAADELATLWKTGHSFLPQVLAQRPHRATAA